MGAQRAGDDLATAHHQPGSTLSGLDALAASWECGLGQVPHVPVYKMDLTILTPCLICKMSLIVTPLSWVSLVAQMVKNPYAIQEIQVQPLEGIPNPVFLPGKSHGQRSLVGYICEPGVAKSQTQLNDYHR